MVRAENEGKSMRIRPVLPLLAILSLVACGDGGTSPESESGGGEAAAEAPQVPVQTVGSIEIGRTRDGFLITAHGTAPGLGYSLPTLRPRRDGAPGVDGYIEYDFVATEPPAGFELPTGTREARELSAYLPIGANALRGAAGIRVLALRGGAQLDFAPAPPPPS
jgi:hypothetical protein